MWKSWIFCDTQNHDIFFAPHLRPRCTPSMCSIDLKARVLYMCYSFGYTVKEIWWILNFKKTIVYETLRCYTSHGVCYNPDTLRRGRRRQLTSTDFSFIPSLISQHRTIYFDEIQEELLTCRGVWVSMPTLTRSLHHLHLTNKNQIQLTHLKKSLTLTYILMDQGCFN